MKKKDPLFEYNEDEVDSKLGFLKFKKRKELEMWKDILNMNIIHIGKYGNKGIFNKEKGNEYNVPNIDEYKVTLSYKQYYFSGGALEPMNIKIEKGDNVINIHFYSEDFFKIYINGKQIGQYGSESNDKLVLNPDDVKNKLWEVLKIIRSKGSNISTKMVNY